MNSSNSDERTKKKYHHITKRNNATKLFTIFIFIIYYKHFCATQLWALSLARPRTWTFCSAKALTSSATKMEMRICWKFLRQMNGKSACWSEKYHKCMHISSDTDRVAPLFFCSHFVRSVLITRVYFVMKLSMGLFFRSFVGCFFFAICPRYLSVSFRFALKLWRFICILSFICSNALLPNASTHKVRVNDELKRLKVCTSMKWWASESVIEWARAKKSFQLFHFRIFFPNLYFVWQRMCVCVCARLRLKCTLVLKVF